jgi:hypothetical protein
MPATWISQQVEDEWSCWAGRTVYTVGMVGVGGPYRTLSRTDADQCRHQLETSGTLKWSRWEYQLDSATA